MLRVFLIRMAADMAPSAAATPALLRECVWQLHRQSATCRAGDDDSLAVHTLWLEPTSLLPQAQCLLSDSEAQRAARLRADGARQTYVLAHAALRLLLAFELAAPDVPRQEFATGPFGKPRLAESPAHPHFSLSWRPGIAAVALGNAPLGVDVELRREDVDTAGISQRFFAAQERAALAAAADPGEFFRLWTRKEALIKAAGAGIDQLPVAGALESRASLVNEWGVPATYCLYSLSAPRDCSLALAVELPRSIAPAASHDPNIS